MHVWSWMFAVLYVAEYFFYAMGYISSVAMYCMPSDTSCKLQDTSVCHGIFFLCLMIPLYIAGYFFLLRDTSCILRDTFGVTHIAASKHESEIDWLGTEREPFSTAFPKTKIPFRVF